jgi:hypothetical protein
LVDYNLATGDNIHCCEDNSQSDSSLIPIEWQLWQIPVQQARQGSKATLLSRPNIEPAYGGRYVHKATKAPQTLPVFFLIQADTFEKNDLMSYQCNPNNSDYFRPNIYCSKFSVKLL